MWHHWTFSPCVPRAAEGAGGLRGYLLLITVVGGQRVGRQKEQWMRSRSTGLASPCWTHTGCCRGRDRVPAPAQGSSSKKEAGTQPRGQQPGTVLLESLYDQPFNLLSTSHMVGHHGKSAGGWCATQNLGAPEGTGIWCLVFPYTQAPHL